MFRPRRPPHPLPGRPSRLLPTDDPAPVAAGHTEDASLPPLPGGNEEPSTTTATTEEGQNVDSGTSRGPATVTCRRRGTLLVRSLTDGSEPEPRANGPQAAGTSGRKPRRRGTSRSALSHDKSQSGTRAGSHAAAGAEAAPDPSFATTGHRTPNAGRVELRPTHPHSP